ncbi:arylamine N-acetyltransferase [Streptomyces sp. NPDC088554]|uniref:arylamine N-acetyltransferase family protein n=1 Tax=Streptomyces sp. NPDC088554 TaxID=3365865 RepID=UPI003829989E
MTEPGWGSEELDLPAYLARIGFEEPVDPDHPTLEVLQEIHRLHVSIIPFENIDILLGRPVHLDIGRLQRKLVHQRRGGYCFEQNLLFAAALEKLGYSFTGLAARVRMGTGNRFRARTHMLLRVEVAGESWVADVGFGSEGLLNAVPLRAGAEPYRAHGGRTYRLKSEELGVRVLQSLRPEGWSDLYAFTHEPYWPTDYKVISHYTSTHRDSPFTGRIVLQRTTHDRRYALVGRELTTGYPDGTAERGEIPVAEIPKILSEIFLIELSDTEKKSLLSLLD